MAAELALTSGFTRRHLVLLWHSCTTASHRFRKSEMALSSVPVKRIFRRSLLVALLGVGLIAGAPSFAAPLNRSSMSNSNNQQFDAGSSIDIQSMPCRVGPGRTSTPNVRGGDACPNVYGNAAGNRSAHRPGPSAFGLQFDTGDY